MQPWIATTLSSIVVAIGVITAVAVAGSIILTTIWVLRHLTLRHIERWREERAQIRERRAEHELTRMNARMEMAQMERANRAAELEASFDHKFGQMVKIHNALKQRYARLREDLTMRHDTAKELNSRCMVLAAQLQYVSHFVEGFLKPIAETHGVRLGNIIPKIPEPPPIYSLISLGDKKAAEELASHVEHNAILVSRLSREQRMRSRLEDAAIAHGLDLRAIYSESAEDFPMIDFQRQLFLHFQSELEAKGKTSKGSDLARSRKAIEKVVERVRSMDHDDVRRSVAVALGIDADQGDQAVFGSEESYSPNAPTKTIGPVSENQRGVSSPSSGHVAAPSTPPVVDDPPPEDVAFTAPILEDGPLDEIPEVPAVNPPMKQSQREAQAEQKFKPAEKAPSEDMDDAIDAIDAEAAHMVASENNDDLPDYEDEQGDEYDIEEDKLPTMLRISELSRGLRDNNPD